MDQQVTRAIWNIPAGLVLFLFLNDQAAEAEGSFGFPITWWA